jgi:uncharacterized membrane protein
MANSISDTQVTQNSLDQAKLPSLVSRVFTKMFKRSVGSNQTAVANQLPEKVLDGAAKFWFFVATIGIWVFGLFVLIHFGGAAITGNIEKFNTGDGSMLATLSILIHVVLASIVILAGPLQLIPIVRARFPRFHRWNGRVFVSVSLVVSLAGFVMLWTRDSIPGGKAMMIALNGLVFLVILSCWNTVKNARARQLVEHRKWALRLFLVVNAGWFFRVGLVAWSMVLGPVGFNPETFEGPFIQVMAFAQYMIPLAVLEMYFRAQNSQSGMKKSLFAGFLVLSTLVMAAGIFGAAMGMWLPHIM